MRPFLTLAALAALTFATSSAFAESITQSDAKQAVRKMVEEQHLQLRVGSVERNGDKYVVTLLTAEGIPARKVVVDSQTGQIEKS